MSTFHLPHFDYSRETSDAISAPRIYLKQILMWSVKATLYGLEFIQEALHPYFYCYVQCQILHHVPQAITCGALAVPVNDPAPALTCPHPFCPGPRAPRMTDDDGYCQPQRGPAQVCNPMPPSKTQNAQAEPGAKLQGQSLTEKRDKAVYTVMERSATSCPTAAQDCQRAASLGIAISRLFC